MVESRPFYRTRRLRPAVELRHRCLGRRSPPPRFSADAWVDARSSGSYSQSHLGSAVQYLRLMDSVRFALRAFLSCRGLARRWSSFSLRKCSMFGADPYGSSDLTRAAPRCFFRFALIGTSATFHADGFLCSRDASATTVSTKANIARW
jgi:hypothetical protein